MAAKKSTSAAGAAPIQPAFDPIPLVFIAIAFLAWSVLLWLRYWTFQFIDWDLALSTQMLWNVGHGDPFSSIMQVHFLGNHANLVVYALAPLFKLVGHPYALLLLKVFFCTFAAYPLYLIARPVCGTGLARAVTAAFLLYPPLSHTIAFEFDFESAAPFLLMWLWYFYLRGKKGWFLAAAVPCLLLKEGMPLILVMFGLAGLVRRKEKLFWAGVLAVSAAYFLAAVFWIVPAHRGTAASAYWELYGQLGATPVDVLKSFVLRPWLVAGILASWSNLLYLALLFGPVGGLALAGADKLLIALPVFLQNMLSFRFQDQMIFYHYAATPTAFVFVATVYGMGRLLGRFRSRAAAPALGAWLLLCSAAGQLLWGPWGIQTPEQFLFPKRLVREDLDWKRAELVRRIPPEAPVIASFHFLAPLSARPRVYGFHNVYMNRNRMSDAKSQYVTPSDAEYVLIDMNDVQLLSKLMAQPNLVNNIHVFFNENPWRLEEAVESVLFFRRGEQGAQGLYEISEQVVELPRGAYWQFDGGLRLVKPEQRLLGTGKPGSVVSFDLIWQTPRRLEPVYGIAFAWFNEQGALVKQGFHPIGYRILATPLWPAGKLIREHYRALVPAGLPPGRYQVQGRVVDELRRQEIRIQENGDGHPYDLLYGTVEVTG